MNLKQINQHLSVADQVSVQDVRSLAEAGFKSIICNRPDAEEPEQPAFAVIQAAAEAHGLGVAFLPVISGKVTDVEALHFSQLLDMLPRPILAYCRTGTRSTTLWSMAEGLRGAPLPAIPSTG